MKGFMGKGNGEEDFKEFLAKLASGEIKIEGFGVGEDGVAGGFAKVISSHNKEDMRVVKSIPATKEQWAAFEVLDNLTKGLHKKLDEQKKIMIDFFESIEKEQSKHASVKKGFWARIEQDLDEYEAHLSMNTKTREIEYLEPKKKAKPVKSPFFKK